MSHSEDHAAALEDARPPYRVSIADEGGEVWESAPFAGFDAAHEEQLGVLMQAAERGEYPEVSVVDANGESIITSRARRMDMRLGN